MFPCPQKEVTGLGVTVCRHDFPISVQNIFSGERHAYALVAYEELLRSGLNPSFWWYDINCR